MITLQAILDGVSTHKDGSLGVRLSTQELTTEQKVELMAYVDKFGWFCFKENAFVESDVPVKDAEGKMKKTPSQRLRNVLFLLWRDKSDHSMTQDQYYERELEKIIENYKKYLD